MAPKGTRRGPNCWFNDTGGNPSKAWRLWAHSLYRHLFSPDNHLNHPSNDPLHLGSTSHQTHMHPTNRHEGTNRLLIRWPYESSRSRRILPNHLGHPREYYLNDSPRTSLISPILPGKPLLRTNTHPNSSTQSRVKAFNAPLNIMMTNHSRC